jgi:anti-anti-sigma factor
MSVRNFAAPIAAPIVPVGRTIEQTGKLRLRNIVGSGMIRLVLKSSPPKGGALRFGKTNVVSFGSVKGGALPALSCQVWKCIASVGPMLTTIRRTSTLVTLCAARRAVVDLQISIRESGDVTILDLQGRATIGADSDLLSSPLQRLAAKGVQKLLLNLAGVTQLDSSGISAITRMSVSLSRQGGSLVLEVLRVIHLPDIIPTFEDETEALASFRPQVYSARP